MNIYILIKFFNFLIFLLGNFNSKYLYSLGLKELLLFPVKKLRHDLKYDLK